MNSEFVPTLSLNFGQCSISSCATNSADMLAQADHNNIGALSKQKEKSQNDRLDGTFSAI